MPERAEKTGASAERVFAPAYLWEFRCDGAACGSRCCRGWRIPVDSAARERFASLPKKTGDAIISNLVEAEQGWKMAQDETGNCTSLCEDGLCRLQKEYGEDYLPDVCDSYPRVTYRFSDFTERSLALTCPLAARLALLPRTPMRFEERIVPARRNSPMSRPPMEAQRSEENLRALQRQMIEILQNRDKPIRIRFLRLGRFLSTLGARCGNRIPDEAALASCAENAALDAETRPRAPAYTRLRYMAELLAELYEAEEQYTPARLNTLAASLADRERESEEMLESMHGHILENLAVNELFLRLYPFSCAGGFLENFKLFTLRFRAATFPLQLQAAAKNAAPDDETALLLLERVMEKLDHNRDADRILKRRAAEDFQGMDADEVMSFL